MLNTMRIKLLSISKFGDIELNIGLFLLGDACGSGDRCEVCG